VYARDSRATVVIYPSDHFIYPRERFLSTMESAVQAVEDLPDLLVLLGVPADSLEPDYGWICPAQEIWRGKKSSVLKVKKFLEKPSRESAAAAIAGGGLWNTMIMAVKAHTLWQLGRMYAPEVIRHFERLYEVIGTSREEVVLESIYEEMPSRNFSADLLAPAASHIGLLPMKDVIWSDWGRKRRIEETLEQIGKKPNFHMIPASRNGGLQKQTTGLSVAS
jgi:mannose-1-phosphate guanylyltransferase